MSEKKVKETAYDKLNDQQKSAQIPYYVHEMEMTRLDRINKRLWIILIVIFLAFVGTNAGWIVYESQFEDIYVSQENEDGYNNYIGNDGDIYNGESATSHQNPQEESGR